MRPSSILELSRMVKSKISVLDIESLPDKHRELYSRIHSYMDTHPPLQIDLTAGSHLPKNGLTQNQLSMIIMIHSLRGDLELAIAEVDRQSGIFVGVDCETPVASKQDIDRRLEMRRARAKSIV